MPAGREARERASLFKALVAGARAASGPAQRHASLADQTRRYALMANGILEDLTRRVSDSTLRQLAQETATLAAVYGVKIDTIVAHFRPPEDEKSVGWTVKQEEANRPLSGRDASRAREVERIVRDGGMLSANRETLVEGVWDGNGERLAPGLEAAVAQLAYDSLVLDKAFISIEGSKPRANGKSENPVMFWTPEDGSLIRRVDRKAYIPRERPDLKGRVEWVMLDPLSPWGVQREYTAEEGALLIRNQRTDQMACGYGLPEIVQCYDAVVTLRYVIAANRNWHTESHIPQGFLVVPANLTDEQVEDLRTELMQEITPESPYKVPVIRAPAGMGREVQFIPVHDRTRMDMMFRALAEYCIAEICAVNRIAPEEINFSSFGQKPTLSEADPESTIQASQYRGVLPVVLKISAFLDKALVKRIGGPEFRGEVQGVAARYNPEMLLQAQLDEARGANGMTVNQIRALNDEPPMRDPLDQELYEEVYDRHRFRNYPTERTRQEEVDREYRRRGGRFGSCYDAPLNPVIFQVWSQEHLQEAQQTQEDMRGMASAADADERQGAQAEAQFGREQVSRFGQAQAEGADAEGQGRVQVTAPRVQDALLRKGVDGWPRGAGQILAERGERARRRKRVIERMAVSLLSAPEGEER